MGPERGGGSAFTRASGPGTDRGEIADVGIGLVLLCERIGVDLVGVMLAKVKKNEERYPVEGSRGKAERP